MKCFCCLFLIKNIDRESSSTIIAFHVGLFKNKLEEYGRITEKRVNTKVGHYSRFLHAAFKSLPSTILCFGCNIQPLMNTQ